MDIGLQQSAYNRSQAGQSRSLTEKRNHTGRVEAVAEAIFTLCAFFAVFAVGAITLYMIANGVPAGYRRGLRESFFSSVWNPAAAGPSFGILCGPGSGRGHGGESGVRRCGECAVTFFLCQIPDNCHRQRNGICGRPAPAGAFYDRAGVVWVYPDGQYPPAQAPARRGRLDI